MQPENVCYLDVKAIRYLQSGDGSFGWCLHRTAAKRTLEMNQVAVSEVAGGFLVVNGMMFEPHISMDDRVEYYRFDLILDFIRQQKGL